MMTPAVTPARFQQYGAHRRVQGGAQARDFPLPSGASLYAVPPVDYDAINIAATPLNNAQPWRLFCAWVSGERKGANLVTGEWKKLEEEMEGYLQELGYGA